MTATTARVSNQQIFTNVSMAANAQSSPYCLYNVNGYCIQLIFTGSPVGTMSVYVSNDLAIPTTDWTLLANSTLNVSAAGDIMYNIQTANYNWVYVLYTATSGSGTLNGTINLKDRNL